jgi:uncharacterized protein (TIGR00290 family)
MKPRAVFCWSGGKDSAMALHRILQQGHFEIVSLLTTLNENHRRISMHGVRETLLDKQAASIGIPLQKVWVKEGSNEEYEKLMNEKLLYFKQQGVTHIIFGDIFLEDLRAYREKNLLTVGLKAVFPLWKNDTKELIQNFSDQHFRTVTCCISTRFLDESFIGKHIDGNFLKSLPANVDPCGENGEYHSFCYSGPIFQKEILFSLGEKVFKPVSDFGIDETGGFWFIDLVPAEILPD